jgi:hypothetical protein
VRINVAFWNLGNLFDTVDDPISDDFDFTPAKGWTTATQETKVANLAKVVDDMFGGSGPDLLGVCEVENEATLQQLVDAVTVRQDLEIFTFQDASDIRGIDCALIYSNQIFQPITLGGSEPVAPASHIVHNRYPTRDIFEAPLRVVSNNAELIVYINHWPSRSQGRYLSEPLRIAAANHLGRLIDRRLKFTRQELLAMPDTNVSMITVQNRWNRNILAMGDFNDEPFNRSILEELKASSGFDKLEEPVKKSAGNSYLPGVVPYAKLQAPLFNCMWPVLAMPDRGTYHFGSSVPTFNLLDQFIVSRGLYFGESGLKMKRQTRLDPPAQAGEPPIVTELKSVSADVFDSDLMITSATTRRPKKFTFGITNGAVTNNNGFSDHFPIVTTIETI